MKMKDLELLKGIHPGVVLERELAKRNLKKSPFAISLNEYPGIIGDITKGKRKMNTELALRIEQALGLEEGFFVLLQAYYDIKEIKQKQAAEDHPNLLVFRKSLFWDTEISTINWREQKKAVIERVFERGNEKEKIEITRYYGQSVITAVLKNNTRTKKTKDA